MVSRLALFSFSILLLSGCASSNRLGASDPAMTELMNALEEASPDSYGSTRQLVVETFSAIEQKQAAEAGSPAAKVKKVITSVGVILGLGGTIASFIVKDENTKSSIAQASSAVGGVTGIISLVPFGSNAEKARKTHGYLRSELSAFQERWPAGAQLNPEEWSQFKGDSKRMGEMVELLKE